MRKVSLTYSSTQYGVQNYIQSIFCWQIMINKENFMHKI